MPRRLHLPLSVRCLLTTLPRFLVLLGVSLACRAEPLLAPGATLAFSETDLQGQPVRRIVLVLTGEPGATCRGEGWKKVRIQGDSGGPVRHPVYKESEGKIEVLLVSDICDGYEAYTGRLWQGMFSGEHVQYGWGSKTVGRVTGTYGME